MSCIITREPRASIRGKLHHCQTYTRRFSHRRKYTACSSRDHLHTVKARHYSYPQFPRSSLGTRGLQTRSHRQKKKETTAFLKSRSAKASSTKYVFLLNKGQFLSVRAVGQFEKGGIPWEEYFH